MLIKYAQLFSLIQELFSHVAANNNNSKLKRYISELQHDIGRF